jgi:hypothetical protein
MIFTISEIEFESVRLQDATSEHLGIKAQLSVFTAQICLICPLFLTVCTQT